MTTFNIFLSKQDRSDLQDHVS